MGSRLQEALEFHNKPPQNKSANYNHHVEVEQPPLDFAPTTSTAFTMELKQNSDFVEVSQAVRTFLQRQQIDFAIHNQKIYAVLFDKTACVQFKLELARALTTKMPTIQATRLDGDAFTLQHFFEELKTDLVSLGFAESDFLLDEEDESEIVFSDDEDFDMDFSFPDYLQLEYDPNIVSHWCQRLNEGNFEDISNILLLLAWNATNADNLMVIAQFKSQLVRAIFNLLESSKMRADLVIVRNVSQVLLKLAQQNLISLKWDQIEVLLTILLDWAKVKPFNMSKPVSCSQEIQCTLAQMLSSFPSETKQCSPHTLKQLAALAKTTPNKVVKKNLELFAF